jgi:hypothetical protein
MLAHAGVGWCRQHPAEADERGGITVHFFIPRTPALARRNPRGTWC